MRGKIERKRGRKNRCTFFRVVEENATEARISLHFCFLFCFWEERGKRRGRKKVFFQPLLDEEEKREKERENLEKLLTKNDKSGNMK